MSPSDSVTPPTPEIFDIGIVGAGMVGSALACGLANAGYKVVIYDRHAPPPFQADQPPAIRVSALSLASEQLLDTLGALDKIRAMRACPYRRLAVWEDNHSAQPGTWFDCQDVNTETLGSIVENDVTQNALHQAMRAQPNIHLRCPATISQVTSDASVVRIVTEQGSQDQVKLLVGADGALSQVRQWANIGQTTNQYEQQAMVITVEYEGQQQDMTWQEFHSTGPVAFLPLADVGGKHYASLVWYHQPEALDRLMALPREDLMHAIQSTFPQQLPPLVSVIDTGRFPLIKRHAQRYFNGRLVLAGDAAHTINPLAGQGVNLGFQDVAAMIRILSEAKQAGADPGATLYLSHYEAERRPQNTQMMFIMDAFYHAFSNTHAPVKRLRNLGLHLANRLPLAKQEVLKYALGIKSPPRVLTQLQAVLPF